jgi:hypothetical protein
MVGCDYPNEPALASLATEVSAERVAGELAGHASGT